MRGTGRGSRRAEPVDPGAAYAGGERASGQKRLINAAAAPTNGASIAPRITAPANSTIVALDPDIPPKRQRLSFSAKGSDVRWRMDGKTFARGGQTQWLPWPGRHLVQLVGERGEVFDEIRIEVRGAGVKAGKI